MATRCDDAVGNIDATGVDEQAIWRRFLSLSGNHCSESPLYQAPCGACFFYAERLALLSSDERPVRNQSGQTPQARATTSMLRVSGSASPLSHLNAVEVEMTLPGAVF